MTDEIIKISKKVSHEIEIRLLGEWTSEAVDQIKIRTPVITGRLKGSIEESGESDWDGETIEIEVKTKTTPFLQSGTEYAAYVEFGTERQPAQRMFQRGLEATEKIIDEDIAELVEGEFDSQFKRFLKRIF